MKQKVITVTMMLTTENHQVLETEPEQLNKLLEEGSIIAQTIHTQPREVDSYGHYSITYILQKL